MKNLSTIPERLQFYIITKALLFLPFIPLPWRETLLITLQIKVQLGKSTNNQTIYRGKNADSGEK